MREIVFDTETTGLDPRNGDRLVEIGCIEMVNRTATGRVYHRYYNPERDMPAEAEAVHGLSASFLSDKPKFAELVDEMLEFIGDDPLVAHNANFDFGFLNAELARCGLEAISETRKIDTLALARKLHGGGKLSLDALCVRYGIDRSHRVKHGALLDAELLAQLYVELTGGRQIGLELAADTDSAGGASGADIRRLRPTDPVFRPARPHSASEEELAAHAKFLERITSPLWQTGPG
jgi:DNA polymerase III subunit epsilon